MTATKAPILYGPNNKPIASGLYPSRRADPQAYRPRRYLGRDMRTQLSSYDRKELVDLSRQLFASFGIVGTAIRDKNSWAFSTGWDAHYIGTNEAWGFAATEFLRDQFFPNCDRKGQHDWRTLLTLSGMAWDYDGDDVMLLTEDDNGSGFPKVEMVPGIRVGNGKPKNQKLQTQIVEGGAFDGNEIYDGIIFDPTGKPVGIRIIGRNIDTTEEIWTDYSLGYGGNADLAFRPEWHDQGSRGIPLLGRVTLDGLDLQDIDHFLKRGIKRATSIALTSSVEEGEAGVGNEMPIEEVTIDITGASRTVQYEELDGGEMYYHRPGEQIKGISYDTPHPNVEAFVARKERGIMAAVGWFYELVYLKESGRAASRSVCELANESIWRQQSLGMKRTWRAVRYALAKGMKNGFIPRNPDPRDAYFNWDFGMPKPLSVDAGNDEQADRENLKLGTTTKAIIAQKKGFYGPDIQRQRKREILQNAADAAEIVSQTSGKVTFDKALDLLEQRSANPVPPPMQQKAPAPAPKPAK